ncbi:MAG TPA: hypothetical protein VD996_17545 [Chitinophagaceae bacterium]|nr:hypothetical protein [Chitinophagaceae bacterium]
MIIQPAQLDVDSLRQRIMLETSKYQNAIGNDHPFSQTRKIKKQINKLKDLLRQKEMQLQTGHC